MSGTATTIPAVFTTGALAEALGIAPWCIRRVVQRGLVPSVHRLRAGGYCIWSEANVAEAVAALKQAGYLPADAPVPSLRIVDEVAATLARASELRPPRSELEELCERVAKLEKEARS